MPRRTNPQPSTPRNRALPKERKTKGSRTLDAFAIAQQQLPTKPRIRRSRLGEIDDEGERLGFGQREADGDRPAKRIRIQAQENTGSHDSDVHDTSENEWHVGVEAEDEDSELNSDEAMGESDEEKYEGFAFRGSTSCTSKRPRAQSNYGKIKKVEKLDLQEYLLTEPDDESGRSWTDEKVMDEDAVDLATVLDQQEDGRTMSVPQQKRSPPRIEDFSQEEDGSRESDEGKDASASEDEGSTISVSDDEAIAANDARLKSFVQDLEMREKSDPTSSLPRPPLAIGEPSDYGLTPSQKLTIADLLPTVTDPRLRESLKMLYNSDQKGTKVSSKGMLGKLQPPLPKRQQDKLDREAAYEKSKETLGRWVDTVKQNRRAEHISFPLSRSAATGGRGSNQLLPISGSECVTPLESTIQSILQESGLVSKDDASGEKLLLASEELQEKKIPVEQAQVRRAELRKARDLMFREERRSRRIKKIKSKAYRRVHRKERDKSAQEERAALAAAGALDSDGERERQDRRRAEERMGRRHKESRWAKAIHAMGRAAWDEEARSGVNDMALRDEALRRRIEGKEANQSDQSDVDTADDESSGDVSIDDYDELKDQMLQQELERLESLDSLDPSRSKLSAMSFMRKAESTRLAANQAEIDQTRRLLAGEKNDADEADNDTEDSRGRKQFGEGIGSRRTMEGTSLVQRLDEFEEPLSEGDARLKSLPCETRSENWAAKSIERTGGILKKPKEKNASRHKTHDNSGNTDNPWLSGTRNGRLHYVTDEPIISTRISIQDHDDSNQGLVTAHSTAGTKTLPPSSMEDWTSPSESESEATPKHAGDEAKSRENEELVRMAFAGDDVFQAFTDEKKATVDEEDDQVVDNSLPGWGSWTGAGISKKEKQLANSRKSFSTIQGVEPSKRKDAKLERVIINEKQCKKNNKYLAPELPHPFESRQQYERSLRLPLGPEWSTKTSFQDATKPRVLLKQGIIRPMERPMA